VWLMTEPTISVKSLRGRSGVAPRLTRPLLNARRISIQTLVGAEQASGPTRPT
jgi:hypothetical protein